MFCLQALNMKWCSVLLCVVVLTVCLMVCVEGHTHHLHNTQKEREADSSRTPRDHAHYEGGEHHSEFDHEAILGERERERERGGEGERERERMCMYVYMYRLPINNVAINILVPSVLRHEFQSAVSNFPSCCITVFGRHCLC